MQITREQAICYPRCWAVDMAGGLFLQMLEGEVYPKFYDHEQDALEEMKKGDHLVGFLVIPGTKELVPLKLQCSAGPLETGEAPGTWEVKRN